MITSMTTVTTALVMLWSEIEMKSSPETIEMRAGGSPIAVELQLLNTSACSHSIKLVSRNPWIRIPLKWSHVNLEPSESRSAQVVCMPWSNGDVVGTVDAIDSATADVLGSVIVHTSTSCTEPLALLPELIIDPNMISAGQVSEKESVTFAITARNTGSSPVELQEITSGCYLSTEAATPVVVPAHGSAELRFALRPNICLGMRRDWIIVRFRESSGVVRESRIAVDWEAVGTQLRLLKPSRRGIPQFDAAVGGELEFSGVRAPLITVKPRYSFVDAEVVVNEPANIRVTLKPSVPKGGAYREELWIHVGNDEFFIVPANFSNTATAHLDESLMFGIVPRSPGVRRELKWIPPSRVQRAELRSSIPIQNTCNIDNLGQTLSIALGPVGGQGLYFGTCDITMMDGSCISIPWSVVFE